MSPSIAHDLTVAKVMTNPRRVEAQQFEVRRKSASDPTWLPTFGDREGDLVRDRRHRGVDDLTGGSR